MLSIAILLARPHLTATHTGGGIKAGSTSTIVTGTITAAGAGGSTPYSYSWVLSAQTGSLPVTINGSLQASMTCQITGSISGDTGACTATCTVTDNAGSTTQVPVAISIAHI
jgi:hypothetical protein